VAAVGLLGAGAVWAGHRAVPLALHCGPAALRLQAEFVVDRALKHVEASDDQRRQVEAIVARLHGLHRSLRAGRDEARAEALAILSADQVDRARLDALRVRQVQKLEAASRQIAAASADVADVLTPEQRRKLAEWLQDMHR
jgi:Spy/CpxP family protein refolding chaperone